MGVFLGIDAGTQSIKAELIDTGSGCVIGGAQVHFGRELPQYDSPDGYRHGVDPVLCHADPRMWLEALELVLRKLLAAGMPLARVCGISGSGQQHGSVYLSRPIAGWVAGKTLSEQLSGALSRPTAPIWMDQSTGEECRELNARFGPRLQQDTGSPAIARFTGPQIRKFSKQEPERYAVTDRIHLVSSFLCSVLIGGDAPIDFGDGAGMNLLNLNTLMWDSEIVDFTAPGLSEKLPPCVPGNTVAGRLSPYFEQYGFRAGVPVVVFSGDNPNSLIGVGASEPGVAVISLGTSDTLFAAMPVFKTDPAGCGHVFGNPGGGFMSLICFCNGSLAREAVKNQSGATWEFMDQQACAMTRPGNDGRLMLPYFAPECTPPVGQAGVRYNFDPATASAAALVRCILESQALSMRRHSEWQDEKFTRIRITGGASRSKAFCRILADVFQACIESTDVVNSAALGAALRAANAVEHTPFPELYLHFCRTTEVVAPRPELRSMYEMMLQKFTAWESHFC